MARTSPREGRHPAGLVGWFVLLGTAIALFSGLDDPRLATPALTDMAAWADWAAATDPIFTTVAILRLLLIGLTWYLLGATTIQVVARLTRSMAMMRIADALSIPLVRRVVSTTLGVGLAASMVTGATGGAAPRSTDGTAGAAPSVTATAVVGDLDRAPPTMARATTADNAMTATPTMARTSAADSRTGPPTMVQGDDTGPTMLRVDDHVDAPTMSHADDAPGAAAVVRARATGRNAATAASGQRDAQWVVRSGDHLWHVAEHVVSAHLGQPATDAQVDPYWRVLVEVNRDRLPDPANPDLLLPGLTLELPDPVEVA